MSDTEAAPPPAVAAPDLDQIVERYVQLRDLKTQKESDHKKEVATIDAAMAKIENFLLAHLNKSKSEAVRTKAGTFFRQNKTSAQVADWLSISAWIQEDPDTRWAMLEKRVSKGFVDAYRQEHNDLPPGVNWREESAVNIRRA